MQNETNLDSSAVLNSTGTFAISSDGKFDVVCRVVCKSPLRGVEVFRTNLRRFCDYFKFDASGRWVWCTVTDRITQFYDTDTGVLDEHYVSPICVRDNAMHYYEYHRGCPVVQISVNLIDRSVCRMRLWTKPSLTAALRVLTMIQINRLIGYMNCVDNRRDMTWEGVDNQVLRSALLLENGPTWWHECRTMFDAALRPWSPARHVLTSAPSGSLRRLPIAILLIAKHSHLWLPTELWLMIITILATPRQTSRGEDICSVGWEWVLHGMD